MASANHITFSQALRLITDAAAERAQALNQYADVVTESDSDTDRDSDCPIFDSFVDNVGNAAIVQMTNFTIEEFREVYDRLRPYINRNYNTGRGKRSKYFPKDVLFMSLTVCKHGTMWDFSGKIFNIKGPTIERLIMAFIRNISDEAYDIFVNAIADEFKMSRVFSDESTFRTFRMARYATDVTFQQCNRPRGTMEEGRQYFSGKHKLYGYKTEVSVLPNGLAIGCTNHYSGSTADVDMFYKNVEWHTAQLKKTAAERNVTDVGPLIDHFPHYWVVLMDKGYQGAASYVRALIPVKKPHRGDLSRSDAENNNKIASDRIIVENFFGRQSTLWVIVANKWRWAESNYDMIFQFTLAMTNAHILKHPLRAEDGSSFRQLSNRRADIVENTIAKRKRVQDRYRARRRARLSQGVATALPLRNARAMEYLENEENV